MLNMRALLYDEGKGEGRRESETGVRTTATKLILGANAARVYDV